MNTDEILEEYLNGNDWRVKENSSATYCYSGARHYVASKIMAKFCLNKLYPKHIADAHESCLIHIHDLGEGITNYCIGLSLKQLLLEGINGVNGKVSSAPAKHLSSACDQMVNHIGIMQLEGSGARAYNSVDTLLSPFVYHEELTYDEVKQAIQSLIFGLNFPSRWASQPPFSNMSFDVTDNPALMNEYAIFGGALMGQKYSFYKKERDMINKAFLEILLDGDADGRPFAYPIPTYNVTESFFAKMEPEIKELLLRVTAKYGYPYFANFINSDLKPEDVFSMCCRLRIDTGKLSKKMGSLFGAGDNTGSIGVVTINLPHLAYLAEGNPAEFMILLHNTLKIATEALTIKRKIINKYSEMGMFPYTSRYLKNYDTLFSTVGVIGAHEAISMINGIENGIIEKDGRNFAAYILDKLNEWLLIAQNETNQLFNLEATPGEGASYRLAKHDVELFGDKIVTSGTIEEPYYTNSTMLPVYASNNILETVDHQKHLQSKYTGGTVVHVYMDHSPDFKSLESFIRKVFTMTDIPYMSITPTYSICESHGYIYGDVRNCPVCGRKTEVYTRVVGYIRAISNFNIGKRREYDERKNYKNFLTSHNIYDNLLEQRR